MTHLVPLDGTTPVSLSLPEGMEYGQWRDVGMMYARLGKAVQFWLGDWMLYGENKYGEEFAQACSETGYSEESLRGFLWVASRIPPNVRRSTLSWSHHQVVAGSEYPASFLDSAEQLKWSVRELREAVKGPPKPKAVCSYPECPMREEA
jgi:hypothetical protein